ncbi:MAG TPA: DEAD/DEAH box helicase [Acidimicrobiia bacterium]|nr:DEAD/DEAH box helicase [Acidimicrobiia bacterium]
MDHASLDDLIKRWAETGEGDLIHLERFPERDAITALPDPPLPGALDQRLRERGIERLYRHQVAGIRRIRQGTHTVLVSGTSSGKTLTYQVPLVERALEDPRSTALLLYPTKALAQDQLGSLQRYRLPGVTAATYDGDTPNEQRRWVRRHATAVLTNPDMLHVGILPHHQRWADFLVRLRFVVVDEMHTLRGVFGSHVSHLLRRLRRIAAHYGARPTFVFTSATIGNPGELAARLSGLEVEVVEGDDSPRGEKLVALWNPPLLDTDAGRRRSALSDATSLFVDLVRDGHHTIVFSRSRKSTELVYRWSTERLGELANRVAPYRAGYLPADRRAVEQRLFSGELLGVTATNALELGIDVGSLDAAIVTTFPGTIAAFWQQAGRAGRMRQKSLAVLVGGEDALDQWFMANPDDLFARSHEAAVVNPSNPMITEAHTGCAAYELPLSLEDRDILGEQTEEAANRLVQAGHLRLREGKLVWSRRQSPAPMVDIRSSGGPAYTIWDAGTGRPLGTIEEGRAFRDAHPGAVYLHQGETYLVEELDLTQKQVVVRQATVDYYTQPGEEKMLEIIELEANAWSGGLPHRLGRVRVESHIVGYQRKLIGSGEILDRIPLDLPPAVFETQAVWWVVPGEILDRAGVTPAEAPGTLHAAEHAAIAMLPLFAICDRWDVGGLSTTWHPATGTPVIFIYEAYPGGAGVSPIAFAAGARHLGATMEAIEVCPCLAGCPSCIQSPKCGNYNEPLDKRGAVAFLRTALTSGSGPTKQ